MATLKSQDLFILGLRSVRQSLTVGRSSMNGKPKNRRSVHLMLACALTVSRCCRYAKERLTPNGQEVFIQGLRLPKVGTVRSMVATVSQLVPNAWLVWSVR